MTDSTSPHSSSSLSTSSPSTSSQSRQSTTRTLLLYLLIGGWLVATMAGLWWFQQKSVRPFVAADDDPRFWQARPTAELLAPLFASLEAPLPGQVTMFHFWNPDCLCNQISQRHFEGLVKSFTPQQLRIIVVAPASVSDSQAAEFTRLNGQRMTLIREPYPLALPVSPALALFNAAGQMGYFGAYGFGALCTVSNDDFFPNIVRQLSSNEYGPFVNVAGSGCFCPWPKAGQASRSE